jgi:hypothetical protein
MIVTDSFVLLNLPKTGSTFTRSVIKKLFNEDNPTVFDKIKWKLKISDKKVKELKFENVKVNFRSNKDQHGIYDQIPSKYKNSKREIVSTIRDPFTAYISRYNFESWKKHRWPHLEERKKKYPHYPDLSFYEYVDAVNMNISHRLQDVELPKGLKIGELSLQFIQMFCRNHKDLIPKLHKDFKSDSSLNDHFPEITFLRQENLNEELYEFFLRHSWKQSDLAFISNEKKKNVSTTDKYKNYLTDDVVNIILDMEWFLFELFPEYKPENNSLFH